MILNVQSALIDLTKNRMFIRSLNFVQTKFALKVRAKKVTKRLVGSYYFKFGGDCIFNTLDLLFDCLVVQFKLFIADEVRVFSQTGQLVRRIHPLEQFRVVTLCGLKHLQVERFVALSDHSECDLALIAEGLVYFDFVTEHLTIHQYELVHKVFVFFKTDSPFVVHIDHFK